MQDTTKPKTTASATPESCEHQYRETETGPIGATCVKCGDFARLKHTIDDAEYAKQLKRTIPAFKRIRPVDRESPADPDALEAMDQLELYNEGEQ